MTRVLAAFVSGVLFTVGLNLSGMTQPLKILGFLDFTGRYTGAWDPSLIVVMFTALFVHAVLYRLIRRRPAPLLAREFIIPPPGAVDRPLVLGSLLWGAGWGITGLCPGPILAGVGALNAPGVTFFACMVAGMFLHRWSGVGGAR
jgi:uncharacterized membrane protein YedE/YeeE